MTTTRLSPASVVIAEPFSDTGIAVLEDAGIRVVSVVGKPREALHAALADADGLIVRSETHVDRELLARGPRLAVVARAGVGVDAIDVPAATASGIVVLNTPGANTLAATEQTFALMLSLARHTPAAVASIRAGKWERKPFIGVELFGKTLGIVGLGRIGGAVAVRAAAFGMKLIASDPFISKVRAETLARAAGRPVPARRAEDSTSILPISARCRPFGCCASASTTVPTSRAPSSATSSRRSPLAIPGN